MGSWEKKQITIWDTLQVNFSTLFYRFQKKVIVKVVECEKQELEVQLQEEKNSKKNALKETRHERP